MKKVFALIVAIATALLIAGCGGGGSSAPPPAAVNVVPGDTSATVTWNMDPGVEYWVFVAPILNVTPQNCSTSISCKTYLNVSSPMNMIGLTNGTPYSVTINGRTDGGPGGAGTPAVPFVPRLAGATWNVGTPLGANKLSGVAFAPALATGATYVAAGSGGALFSSTNLKATANLAWNPVASGVTANLNSILYSGGAFTAVGDGGLVLISLDAIAWTPQSIGTTSNLYGVATNGAGLYIAVGANGTIMFSGGGTTWAAVDSGTTNDLFGVRFLATGQFIAVGANGTMLTSTDGLFWQALASNTTSDLKSVAFGVPQPTALPLAPVVYAFVAVGAAGTVVTSADGVTWTPVSPFTTSTLNAIVYGTQFVAVGNGGLIFTSPDGINWQPGVSGTSGNLNAITFTSLATAIPGVGYSAVGDAGVNLTSF